MSKYEFKLGTDPEMFLKLGGKAISAHGLFPGTKHDPHPLDGGALQVDGLALEFNIDAAKTEDEFVANIKKVLAQTDEFIKAVDKDLTREFIPYVEFDQEYFASLPDESKILGCDPDYSGRTGDRKPPPEIGDVNFRTAAGHIHIGWTSFEDISDPAHHEDCRFVAEYIGERAFGPDYSKTTCDAEFNRLKYYGGDYAFRPKSYGVEIRFPSNIWLRTEQSQRDAYRTVMRHMTDIEMKAA